MTETFRPGFRISEIDVGILMLGSVGSVLMARFDASLAVAIVFTVAHFFLFCNVLRMSRPLELAWAVLFVALAASTILVDFPSWTHTFMAMLAVTTILAVVHALRPSYHGAFWRQINPNLPDWWKNNGVDEQ